MNTNITTIAMKQYMKTILIILTFSLSSMAFAQSKLPSEMDIDIEQNAHQYQCIDYSIRNTNDLMKTGSQYSSLVNEINASEPANNNNNNNNPRGPQRVSEFPQIPFDDPLTDAVPCLLILAIGYAIYLRKKTGLPTPDSRK